jgi:hypothetical protein
LSALACASTASGRRGAGRFWLPQGRLRYESLEFEVAEVRERAAFSFGWQKGSADGRASFSRGQAPSLSERARQLADQTRALVVTEGLSVVEATALLLETAWSVLLTPPAPPLEGRAGRSWPGSTSAVRPRSRAIP